MLTVDGSSGEGGGQILRSSLSLSLLTGQPFRMTSIRARRRSPGLMRQHLACVLAAAEVGQAEVEGAAVGSTELTFRPGAIRAGDHRFAVGTAGSTSLIFQTLLPALLRADAPSTVTIEGGTHNPMAPSFDYLARVFLPALARMGVAVEASIARWGFYPAGGGQVSFRIEPWSSPRALSLLTRGEERFCALVAAYAGLPFAVAERELEVAGNALGWSDRKPLVVRNSRGPGNALIAMLESEHVAELFTSIGEKGKPAERVASDLVDEVRAYQRHGAPVGEHLADQLLLPMVLGQGGEFRTGPLSQHTRTQIETIQRFVGARVEVVEAAAPCVEVRVTTA